MAIYFTILFFISEYPNHARQFIKTCNLSVISGIIILSGDGVLNEVHKAYIFVYSVLIRLL